MSEEYTTPYEREILTHYWVSPEPWKNGSENWRDLDGKIIDKFVRLGLLRQVQHQEIGSVLVSKIVKNEEALRVYMDALAAVPLPVQRWVIP